MSTSMNYFEYQDRARRRSTLIMVYYLLALLFFILAVDTLVALAIDLISGEDIDFRQHSTLLLVITLATLVSTLIGTGVRYLQLRRQGSAIVELLGAEAIARGNDNPGYQELLNIVDELSLAAGTPVPDVYVLPDEDHINAFTTGASANSAAITVTGGALEKLQRNELMALVAHEFSHILHGDLRVNYRHITFLNGFLNLYTLGLGLMRGRGTALPRVLRGPYRLLGFILGSTLVLLGYAGLWLSRALRRSISRQREFNADQSSVAFTQNPAALVRLLEKVREQGSYLKDRHAEEFSHMCFAPPKAGLLPTHPRLQQRIATLQALPESSHVQAPGLEGFIDSIGRPGPNHLHYAMKLRHQLEKQLERYCNHENGMYLLACSMVLSYDPAHYDMQMKVLRDEGEDTLTEDLQAIWKNVRKLDTRYRLPLLDISLMSLQRLSARDKARLLQHLKLLIEADHQVSITEYVISSILEANLDSTQEQNIRFWKISQVADEAGFLLALLAHHGHNRQQQAEAAYHSGMQTLEIADIKPMHTYQDLQLQQLTRVLARLKQLIMKERKKLLFACAKVIFHDQQVTQLEAELLRAISDSLECPMPPIIFE